MERMDLRKQLKGLYSPSAREPVIVDVPEMGFLMVDGKGDPNTSEEFQDAVAALYGVSFTIKFALKRSEASADHTVMPLEGLWWGEDLDQFSFERKGDWLWTLLIVQPPHVTQDMVAEAVAELRRKGKDSPALSRLRLATFHEGLSVQIMHVGPYCDEPATMARMHDFAREQGYELRGKHHEIYLSDPRRTAPEKLKTVLRQPVTRG